MPEPMRKWTVSILQDMGVLEELGTVEAPNRHGAYVAAIKQFNVPTEHQSRLFVHNAS